MRALREPKAIADNHCPPAPMTSDVERFQSCRGIHPERFPKNVDLMNAVKPSRKRCRRPAGGCRDAYVNGAQTLVAKVWRTCVDNPSRSALIDAYQVAQRLHYIASARARFLPASCRTKTICIWRSYPICCPPWSRIRLQAILTHNVFIAAELPQDARRRTAYRPLRLKEPRQKDLQRCQNARDGVHGLELLQRSSSNTDNVRQISLVSCGNRW